MCVNSPHDFCNVCGKYMIKKNVRVFTDALQQSYLHYFGMLPNITDPWTPKFLCALCQSSLGKWAVGPWYAFEFLLHIYIFVMHKQSFVFTSADTWHSTPQWFGKIHFVTRLIATFVSAKRVALDIV